MKTSRKCGAPGCRKPGTLRFGLYCTCSVECGAAIAQAALAKSRRKEAEKKREDRKRTRARLLELKRRRDWVKEAQAAINRYVRFRDMRRGYGCISCGKMPAGNKPGGSFDCGHWRSRGSAPQLKFHLHGMALQCKRCNDPKYGAGMPIEFERELRARIGDAKVDALKADQTMRKFDIDYLRKLKKVFAKKARREELRYHSIATFVE